MGTVKIKDQFFGENISSVIQRMKQAANETGATYEFQFNDITLLVNGRTVPDWLERDYMNAHTMDWKVVGPECEMQYAPEVEIELCSRKLKAAQVRKESVDAQRAADDFMKNSVDELVSGVELMIIEEKKADYLVYQEKNSKDSYSRCVVDYAEYWAKLMQKEIEKGRTVAEVADETQKPLSFLGITGFMYGAAVSALAHFWVYGEDLKKWHNKQYGADENAKGVVNPAVMTIG